MEKTMSQRIAEFATTTQYRDLPNNVVNQVKRFLFDSLGCAFGSMDTQDVKIMRAVYQEMGGQEEATVIGFGDRLPAVNTTLINSLMIRALDYNDIYWREDPSHPSDLVPAALAAGERVKSSMKDVLVAIVLGYEFEQRLCEFCQARDPGTQMAPRYPDPVRITYRGRESIRVKCCRINQRHRDQWEPQLYRGLSYSR